MKNNIEYKTTDNRSVYNKTRKSYLEKQGLIRCCWCGYHKGENCNHKWYGYHIVSVYYTESKNDIKYPSWKLSTKNRKQWMDKNYKFESHKNFGRKYYTLIF